MSARASFAGADISQSLASQGHFDTVASATCSMTFFPVVEQVAYATVSNTTGNPSGHFG